MSDEVKDKKPGWRKWRMVIFFVAGITFILLIAQPVLNAIVESKVKENLQKLFPVANVSYLSLEADFFSSTLSIKNLSIRLQPDTGDHYRQHVFSFSKADFTGIDFLKVVFNKKLVINKLQLEKGDIKLDPSLFDKTNLLQHELSARMPFKNISVDHFEISEGNLWLKTNEQNKLLLKGKIISDEIEKDNSKGSFAENGFHLGAVQCTLEDINYEAPQSHQTLEIKQLLLDSRRSILRIDSLAITHGEKELPSDHNNIAFFRRIDISEFDVIGLFNKKLIAGKIVINDNRVNIFKEEANQRDSGNTTFPVLNLRQLPVEIRIDSFTVAHAVIECGDLSKDEVKTAKKFFDSANLANFSINHLVIAESNIKLHSNPGQFTIDKIAVDSLTKSINNKLNYSTIECRLSDINYSIPRSYRTVHIKSVTADSKKELLHIDHLTVATQYPKFEFGKKLGRQADYIEAVIPRIEISKLNFKQLLNKKLVADEMAIDNSNFYFFRDRRLPRQLKEQPMPNGYLKEIPVEVRVNTFKINNASVLSEEFPKVGDQAGYLKIDKVNISMSPMLNHPYKSDPRYSDTHVEGSIMNAGLIEASIRAPLREDTYSIKGVIKNLDLPKLNPSAENLGRFHIESGMLNFLEFHFTATEEKATGEIIGEYHDLLIDRLKPKSKEVARVPTFFLKHFIIPKNKDKSLDVAKRTGKIDYKRDPTRIVSFYFLKALLHGIRASFELGFLLPK
ncbi:hypothetical protein QTN47_25815 [Danxiaibacter flavus]|uniref:DUF748 domain-containing protein n=1 Tax=Danxiaibacter flavus TaxID=3049108 RepID=A0ABV3ZMB2_9BACT|nr:hypothetical protein QNM32_25815 [Chitinophagaceae bacterium DXS]